MLQIFEDLFAWVIEKLIFFITFLFIVCGPQNKIQMHVIFPFLQIEKDLLNELAAIITTSQCLSLLSTHTYVSFKLTVMI